MTQSKNTKRALLASILSLVLCFAMLIGSTFAWFTDSVTSGGNKIVAGNLDVEMEWANGTEPLETENWKDASKGAIFNYDKWEPGYTEVRHIRVTNKGSLALKYQLQIAADGEVGRLAEVIDVYVFDNGQQITDRAELVEENKIGTLKDVLAGNTATPYENKLSAGDSHTVTIALKMQETAGNEYQGQSIGTDFSIQLIATQYTEESDSFNNQYDENAGFSIEVPNGTAASLQKALYAAKENDTVILTQNTSTTENLSINRNEGQQLQDQSIFIDLNKKTFTTTNSSGFGLILRAGSATISNGKMSTNNADGAFGVLATSGGEALYFNDLVIENFKNNGVAVDVRSKTYTKLSDVTIHSQNGGGFTTYGTADLYDCTMTQTGYYNWNSNNVSVSNGGTVNVHSGNYTSGNYGLYIYNSGGTINIYDGTFKADRAVLKADYNTGSSTINVYGGRFDGKIEIASGARLNILEGTFTNTGLTLDQFETYVAEGSAVTEADGIFTVAR